MVRPISIIATALANVDTVMEAASYAILAKLLLVQLAMDEEGVSIAMDQVNVLIVTVLGRDKKETILQATKHLNHKDY